MAAKKPSTKIMGDAQAEPPTFTPRKEFPIRIDPTLTQTENAKFIARDILSPETAAMRVTKTAEGTGGLSNALDVPAALHDLRRQAAAVNAGDPYWVEDPKAA